MEDKTKSFAVAIGLPIVGVIAAWAICAATLWAFGTEVFLALLSLGSIAVIAAFPPRAGR